MKNSLLYLFASLGLTLLMQNNQVEAARSCPPKLEKGKGCHGRFAKVCISGYDHFYQICPHFEETCDDILTFVMQNCKDVYKKEASQSACIHGAKLAYDSCKDE